MHFIIQSSVIIVRFIELSSDSDANLNCCGHGSGTGYRIFPYITQSFIQTMVFSLKRKRCQDIDSDKYLQ